MNPSLHKSFPALGVRTVLLAQRLPELFIGHQRGMVRAPVRIDAIPSIPLEDMATRRTHPRQAQRKVLCAAQALARHRFSSNSSGAGLSHYGFLYSNIIAPIAGHLWLGNG